MIIREAEEEDAAALLAIYSTYVKNTAVTFEWTVPTEEEFRGRIRNTKEHFPYLVAEEDGVPVGYCYAGKFRPRESYHISAEASVYVRFDRRHGGIGKQLYEALLPRLRGMGIRKLYAIVVTPSEEDPESPEYVTEGSLSFHKSIGFAECGRFVGCAEKFGHIFDAVFLGRSL